MSVGDDSDDGEGVSIAHELAVDGALTGPDGFGGGFGDDCILWCAIVLVEWAAFDDVLLRGWRSSRD